MRSARSILIVDAAGFGGSVFLLPALREIRRSNKSALIAAAASKGACELFLALGLVDQTIDLGVIRPHDRGGSSSFGRLVRLFRRARRENFDLVIDFQPRVETQLVARLVVRARTVTPTGPADLLDALLTPGRGRRQRQDRRVEAESVLRQLGLQMPTGGLGICSFTDEDLRFEQALNKSGSRGGEPVVVMFSASAGGLGAWPVASFAELAARLENNFGARVVAADEPGSTAFTTAITPLLGAGAIKVAEPTAMQLVAAVARASFLVTDEAGVARMALDLGTPAIEIADRPCADENLRAYRVVHAGSRSRVSVDHVFEAAASVLQQSRSEALFQRS